MAIEVWQCMGKIKQSGDPWLRIESDNSSARIILSEDGVGKLLELSSKLTAQDS